MANTQHNVPEQHRNGLAVSDDSAVLVKFNGFYGLVPMPVVDGVTKEQSDAINGFRLSRVQTKGQGVINAGVKAKLTRAETQAKLNTFCTNFDLAAALAEGGETKAGGRSRDTLLDLRADTAVAKRVCEEAIAKMGKRFDGPESLHNSAVANMRAIMAKYGAEVDAEIAALIDAGYVVSAKGTGGTKDAPETVGELPI